MSLWSQTLHFSELFCLQSIYLQDLTEADAFFQILKPCIMEPCTWAEGEAGREGFILDVIL